MNRELIRRIILENQEFVREVEINERDLDFEDNGLYVLVGVRQAGKSYALYQRARQHVARGGSVEDIALVNFDDERLMEMTADQLDLVLQAYRSLYDAKPFLMFDEIQNVPGWEHFARRLANQKYRVFITGSNANMLSKEISTTLGGRYLTRWVYPYQFSEFLRASRIDLPPHTTMTDAQAGRIQQAFSDYFVFGGFPDLVNYRDKRGWLNNLYDKILLGDIAQRNKVRSDRALRLTMRRLAECVGQPVSYNRLSGMVKSAGAAMSVATAIGYVGFTQEACLTFAMNNYASQFCERETVKKHYFVDNGLLSILLLDPESALLENICALRLRRLYGDEVYYYSRGVEVDFIVPGRSLAVQAAFMVDDPSTLERETRALERLAERVPIDRMLIVTRDEEARVDLGAGRSIEVVPVWKWLLWDDPSGQ